MGDAIKDAAFQFTDNRYDSENIPASKDPDSNPTDEEEYEAFLDEDMYCFEDRNTINSVVNESLQLVRTVKDVRINTNKTYEQVRIWFAPDCLYRYWELDFV